MKKPHLPGTFWSRTHILHLLTLTLMLIVSSTLTTCTSDSSEGPFAAPPVTNNPDPLDSLLTPISTIESLFQNQTSDVVVTVKGTVTRVLSDDTVGDRHQRFIIRQSNSQTLLIAHNIDIASRVSGISVNSLVYVHGDYVWNAEGGLVHWTHHDPAGVHENGWIVFKGVKYE